jgi:hypothetical protein
MVIELFKIGRVDQLQKVYLFTPLCSLTFDDKARDKLTPWLKISID